MMTFSRPSVEKITEVVIQYMFPEQKVSANFKEQFKKYLEHDIENNHCTALYIAKDPNLTQSFRNFMKKFPELDCEKRQILVYPNGSVSFRHNYHNDKAYCLLEVV